MKNNEAQYPRLYLKGYRLTRELHNYYTPK